MLQQIEEKNQATDLEKLVGKFTSEGKQPRHLNRVIKILDCLRNTRVLLSESRRDRKYLLNQIAQRDLMIEDCHNTMESDKRTIMELQRENRILRQERLSEVA